MKKEYYVKEMSKKAQPYKKRDIVKLAIADTDITKAELAEIIDSSFAPILTLKEVYLKNIIETSSSDVIITLVKNARLNESLNSEEIQEIQYQAIVSLKDMIVRY